MRVLFDHSSPFMLAHGGFQIQIEQTAAALRNIGVEIEFVRWWDDRQAGDIIHYFGRPPETYVQLAQKKGIKLVIADLLTEMGSRSRLLQLVQKSLIKMSRTLPRSFTARMGWKTFKEADAVIALTPWEAQLMGEMFGAPAARTHVVPNGVEELFFEAASVPRGPWLVCTATITQRKRVVELAEAAAHGQIPVWIIGQPYSQEDPYAARFIELAKNVPRFVRYEGAIHDRRRLTAIYREARGFVLLSTMESLSLSALEAAACECPLLLSDLPWARTTFGERASYCRLGSTARTAEHLRKFYDQAPRLPLPPKPLTWMEVAQALKKIYQGVLEEINA